MDLANVRNPKRFWLIVKRLKPHKRSPCSISRKALTDFYEKIYPPRYNTLDTFFDCSHPFLDQDINFEELYSTLQSLKDNKARGNYRGIALMNSITKIFTNVLASRLSN